VKLWPFVVVLVGLVLAGIVYIWVREPEPGAVARPGRELPRLPLDRIEAPLPPRFAGPLPTRVEEFEQELEKGPPLSYVRARLLEGDREMGAKLFSALGQAAESAWNPGELWETYGVVLGVGDHRQFNGDLPDKMNFLEGFHDEGVPCGWLREWLSQPLDQSPLLTELLWRKLTRCPGAETTALFAREDAPIQWVLDHHSLFDHQRSTPALEGTVRRILEQNRYELFQVAQAYLDVSQEPVARELREQLWRRASAEMRAKWEQEAEEMELERRREEEHPWKCPPIPTRPEGIDKLTVSRCLDQWVAASWAETARFAMSAARSPELQKATVALATVRNFSSVAELTAWARERKLLPEAAPAPEAGPPSLYLDTLLQQAQRAFQIDLMAGNAPRRHDELLVALAWAVRPELAGAVFEQLSDDEYTLRAYADGQRFSVRARNSPLFEDIGAVLGLLNQVLEARGSSRRFAVLDTTSHQVTVVFGPEAALREADAMGLWRLGDGKQVVDQAEARMEQNARCILFGECPF
jgi:hypothetical protein